MRFQCGTCGKYYLIENAEQISKQQKLRCIACGNIFVLQKNLTFFSSSKNSKLICNHCGSLVDEFNGICPICNPALKNLREEFMIDNREYEFFVVRKGRVRPKYGSSSVRTTVLVGGAVLLTAAALFALLPGSTKDALKIAVLKPLGIKSKIKTQLVIMRSGQTYYTEKVEQQGTALKIIEKNGNIITVDQKNIVQIAEAVTEQ